MGNRKVSNRGLVVKPEEKKPLGRLRPRWEDDIKVQLHEVVMGAATGFIWLRIGTSGGRLGMRSELRVI